MLSFLKNHPFPVQAFFKSSVVLTFAFPKEEAARLLPECLEPDTFKDKWAFIAVALVQTKGLRPKGFHPFTGSDFFLIGYRIFVRYKNVAGKNLRGLYILKSETDKRRMQFFGNIFTHYNYTTTDIITQNNKDSVSIFSKKSGFHIQYTDSVLSEHVRLPDESPFSDWKEARRFAGPLPFTFTYNNKNREVLIIEGVRENWNPVPLKVQVSNFPFLEELKLSKLILANAFVIRNIPYHWKKGKKELWKREENFKEF